VTGVVLFAVGAVLTFELLPRDIGRHLPVLSSSLWTRAILLLDVGILLLAACGIDFILGLTRRRAIAGTIGIILCVVHAVDVGHQFRKFNGATPAEYFYPVGTELEALRASAQPFQYVAQDVGYFLFSGTTGAIGLGDWFAHALRTPQLQNFLDAMSEDPFTSPTATGIPIFGYHIAQPVADGGGLCYAAYGAGQAWGKALHGTIGNSQKALPPISKVPVTQPFALARPGTVASVIVRLATYRDKGHDGNVALTLKPVGQDKALATASIPAEVVRDNQMALFRFAKPVSLPAGSYELVLLYTPGPKRKRMTAWTLADAGGSVLHGTKPHPGSLVYALIAPEDGSVEELAVGSTIGVAKSTSCVEGAYWVSDLTRLSATAQPGRAKLLDYDQPHAFSVEVSASEAGFLVVPMQYQRGWVAEVDGQEVGLHLAHGVMPAVPVPAGNSRVELSYRPPGWWAGLLVTLSALLVLAWLLLPGRRRSPPRLAGAASAPVNGEA